jgi:hypothetical protein
MAWHLESLPAQSLPVLPKCQQLLPAVGCASPPLLAPMHLYAEITNKYQVN